MISPGEWKKFCEPWKADNHLCEVSIPNREIAAGRGYGSHQTWNRLFWKKCKNLDGIKTGEDKTGGSKMKKLTTVKIWQFAAGQFGWALLSGIISNWLVYFYQPDETAISLYEAQQKQDEINAQQDDALLEIYELIGK